METSERGRRTVAIACQGGGSHTAFTAGVLDRLLAEDAVEYDIVELSGTSGGAICAFATWFGLASDRRGDGRHEARRLLAQIWHDISAKSPADIVMNELGVGTVRAQNMGVPFLTVSPYDSPLAGWSRKRLRTVLEDAVDPDNLADIVGSDDPLPPRLDIGAVDLQRGTFKTFTERDVSHDAVLASAAVPPLFQAAPVTLVDGSTRWYWDGLFSQNPPLSDLFGSADGRLERASELWIVQVNPQREDQLPKKLEEIADRRNELAGNLSVNQELRFIKLLNQWRAEGKVDETYRPLEVKTINLDESLVAPGRPLDYASKLDRSERFIERLWEHGRSQADRFISTERDRRHVRQAAESTWTRERDDVRAQERPSTYTVHLPTSLTELRAFLQRDPEQEVTTLGWSEYRQFVESVHQAFPDLQFSVEELVAETGKVALRWHGVGTHSGTLFDIEPTGRDVRLSGMSIHHLTDGQLSESWTLSEQWSLLQQIEAANPSVPLPTASRVSPTPVVTQLSAPVENEELARTEVTELWNRGRRDVLAHVLDEGCVVHLDDGSDRRGREPYWEFVQRYRQAFPDLTVGIRDTVSEGDKIVLRLTVRGTHEGPFLGVHATGRRIDVDRMVIHHLDDGRIVETGVVEDTVRLLHQLGASPSAVAT
ncbi:conserved hypothetical protein, steroid delta-isomerase-related [Halogranum rubrum]|uniref:PNPLA domain-containing protein n=1 Tax=Halogranum rubrum TaxID=553466 RepID=A0A1I4CQK9_9EURY|nr:ester cyclase [Halogranum rubrum]SFK83542.1 conserved hypothetical protein, steroid delta-isomerase-related [Halogranum rubrum]